MPLVLAVSLVGGYLVYRSFAASSISCTTNSATSVDVERCITISDQAKIARLYFATYGRTPDQAGLNYWVGELNNGKSLTTIARAFVKAPEFRVLYGTNPTNREFVIKLYTNVLGRAPSDADIRYWLNELEGASSSTLSVNPTTATVPKTREQVVLAFSESPENRAKFKTQVAQVLKIPMSRVGTLAKSYSASEITCYGHKVGSDCVIEPNRTQASFTREYRFLAGGASWGTSNPKKGLSYTVCADVKASLATTNPEVTLSTIQDRSGVTPHVVTNTYASYAPITQQPKGKLNIGTDQGAMTAPVTHFAGARTTCHDLSDIAGSSYGWFFQIGLMAGNFSNSAAKAGKISFNMNSVRLYQTNTNHRSARLQAGPGLIEYPDAHTAGLGPMRPQTAALPSPYNGGATPWVAQNSSPIVRRHVAAEDAQPVWRSQHPAFAGENSITPFNYSPLGVTSVRLEIEYIVKDSAGARIPISRYIILDPVTGREVKTYITNSDNPSKLSLDPSSITVQGWVQGYIRPIFSVDRDKSVTIEVKIHSGHADLGAGISVDRYQFVGSNFPLRYPKIYDTAKLIQEINNYIARHYPNSPMNGMGNRFVVGGSRADVNPLLAVAQANHESGFGTAGVALIGTNNAFGRTALQGQPYVSGTERKWYKWESWQKSLLSDICPANGSIEQPDDWFQFIDRVYANELKNNDLSSFINKYAPAFENNVPAYINAVLGVAYEISSATGGAVDLTQLGTPDGSCN